MLNKGKGKIKPLISVSLGVTNLGQGNEVKFKYHSFFQVNTVDSGSGRVFLGSGI